MADTRWSDVVTTALLGTDRRSVLLRRPQRAIPATSEDPATQILILLRSIDRGAALDLGSHR